MNVPPETSNIDHYKQDNKPALVRPVVNVGQLVEAHKEVSEIITKALVRGQDYGTIPNMGKKEVLFKAGAERLLKAFGCHVTYEITDKVIDHEVEFPFKTKYTSGTAVGLYSYNVTATVSTHYGVQAGQCIGNCSTRETKYSSRPADSQNTVLKMAQKRALVGAVLNAFGLSDRFTQDTEDIRANKLANNTPAGFNPKDITHAEWLEGELTAHKVDKKVWPKVSAAMDGKPSADLNKVLTEFVT